MKNLKRPVLLIFNRIFVVLTFSMVTAGHPLLLTGIKEPRLA